MFIHLFIDLEMNFLSNEKLEQFLSEQGEIMGCS